MELHVRHEPPDDEDPLFDEDDEEPVLDDATSALDYATEPALLATLDKVAPGRTLPRFEQLLDSTAASRVLTTILFASYHIYQGPHGIYSCLIGGFLYGVAFCWL